jgi:hypothetical protein
MIVFDFVHLTMEDVGHASRRSALVFPPHLKGLVVTHRHAYGHASCPDTIEASIIGFSGYPVFDQIAHRFIPTDLLTDQGISTRDHYERPTLLVSSVGRKPYPRFRKFAISLHLAKGFMQPCRKVRVMPNPPSSVQKQFGLRPAVADSLVEPEADSELSCDRHVT